MPRINCGWPNNFPGEGEGSLIRYGPTLYLDIGFDPNYVVNPFGPTPPPLPSITGIAGLVDTGAGESCIDEALASDLGLPKVDKKSMSGISGVYLADLFLAQVHIPALQFTVHRRFAGVKLVASGLKHKALIGRSFLRYFEMRYDGRTGSVLLSDHRQDL